MRNQKAIVLSSGGVDSTTCVGLAVNRFGAENVTTISFKYGQKHSKELDCAEKVAQYYQVAHRVIDICSLDLFKGSSCSLLEGSANEIKHESYEEQIKESDTGIVDSYVPFRNGLMLSMIAAIAMSMNSDGITYIYLGAHADDAAGNAYPDCSIAFSEAMSKAIYEGTDKHVVVCTPLIKMNKAEVIHTGLEIQVPYKLTWSCYEGGDKPCGKCGTCIDRAKAFALNGVEDPALT